MDWFSNFQYKSTLGGSTIQQQRINDKNDLFLAKFKDSPMYNQIGLGSTTNLYDSWISTEDAWKQLIELKKIELAPNQSNLTSNFYKGQYVYWNNDGQNEIWLIVGADQRIPFNPMGMMVRCDNQLKFKDSNGVIQSYYCVIDDKVERDYLRPDKVILLPEGYIQIKLQRNNITNTIIRNQRFLIGTLGNYMAYKVSNVKNYFDFPYLELKMYVDEISPEDDLVNGIANGLNNTYTISIDQGFSLNQSVGYTSTLSATIKNNGVVVTNQPVTWVSSTPTIGTIDQNGKINLLAVGTTTFTASMTNNPLILTSMVTNVSATPTVVKSNIILPNVTDILQGNTQIFSIFQYVNNVANSSTFNISASGASGQYYTLNILDGNHFSISSLGYTSTLLIVTCTNQSDNSTVSININLKGLY